MQNLEEPSTNEPQKQKPLTSVKTYESEWQDDWDHDDSKEEHGAHFCVFKSGSTNYAIPLEMVREVVKERFITPVPHLPSHILGMTNVRGDICAVFDLSIFLGDERTSLDPLGFFMVLNHDDISVAIGVPGVPDTVRFVEDEIKPLRNLTKKVKRPNYLGGVMNRDDKMIISLKIEDILESEEFSKASQEVTA